MTMALVIKWKDKPNGPSRNVKKRECGVGIFWTVYQRRTVSPSHAHAHRMHTHAHIRTHTHAHTHTHTHMHTHVHMHTHTHTHTHSSAKCTEHIVRRHEAHTYMNNSNKRLANAMTGHVGSLFHVSRRHERRGSVRRVPLP